MASNKDWTPVAQRAPGFLDYGDLFLIFCLYLFLEHSVSM